MRGSRAAAAVITVVGLVAFAGCSSDDGGGNEGASSPSDVVTSSAPEEPIPTMEGGMGATTWGQPYTFPNGLKLTVPKPTVVSGQMQLHISAENTSSAPMGGSMFEIGFEVIGPDGDVDGIICDGDEPDRSGTILPGRTVKWVDCYQTTDTANVTVIAVTDTATEDEAQVMIGSVDTAE